MRVETNLVTVPVIVSDRGDIYLPDLKQEDFTVFEDGVKQEVSFFETVTAPFHVVLMLDTSASTQDKLNMIQQAAISFTEQLQKADRVKVISFDDRVRDLSDFTSDRAVLQWAIRDTRPGQGTKLYDAVAVGIKALQRIKGRKAIVIFTDGVDSYSDRETYNRNVRLLEEAGIIVYPIRFDTRADVEELVRRQQQQGQGVDLATILGGKLPGGGGDGQDDADDFPRRHDDSGRGRDRDDLSAPARRSHRHQDQKGQSRRPLPAGRPAQQRPDDHGPIRHGTQRPDVPVGQGERQHQQGTGFDVQDRGRLSGGSGGEDRREATPRGHARHAAQSLRSDRRRTKDSILARLLPAQTRARRQVPQDQSCDEPQGRGRPRPPRLPRAGRRQIILPLSSLKED